MKKRKDKKLFKDFRDVIYRLRYNTWKDPTNKGYKIKLTLTYLKWYFFYKYFGQKHLITFQNNYKSWVYPYPDHDAGEANIFTRNVDYADNQFIRKILKPGDFIVDAGCNVGNRTWVLADIIGGALLIDPNPVAILRAKENLLLNGLDPNKYYFVEKGVGEKSGEKYFTDLGGASTQNTIVEDNPNGIRTRCISITTIDEELMRIGKMPAFIKIDVEGYDYQALLGAKNTLQNNCVKLVKFENNNKTTLANIRIFFSELGWQVFALDSTTMAPVFDEQFIFSSGNLFASPEKALSEVFS